MSKRTDDYVEILADASDCRMMADGLRVFAREMVEDCRRGRAGAAEPADVAAEAERLREMADTIGAMGGLECCYEALVRSLDDEKVHPAFLLSPRQWRVVAAALGYVTSHLQAAGDRPHAARMADLGGKAEAIASWCAGLTRCIRRIAEAAAEAKPRQHVRARRRLLVDADAGQPP